MESAGPWELDWELNSGHYLLVMQVESPRVIGIGRLGTFNFNPGIYCYAGRARRNLHQRIARHCRKSKSARWHIDHLLPHVNLLGVVLFSLEDHSECGIAGELEALGGTRYPPRFGSSDCRCGGHLISIAGNLCDETPIENLIRIVYR